MTAIETDVAVRQPRSGENPLKLKRIHHVELLKVRTERVQVIVEPLQERLPRCTRFFNDWIFPHDHSSMSSSGVQITGASKPASWHVSVTKRRIRAFAMCLQFHVTR